MGSVGSDGSLLRTDAVIGMMDENNHLSLSLSSILLSIKLHNIRSKPQESNSHDISKRDTGQH